MGYIQDGLLGLFGPTEIVPGGLQGGQKWPKNAIKRAFMAISGSGGSKWLDLSGYWLDMGGIHPGWFFFFKHLFHVLDLIIEQLTQQNTTTIHQ